MGDEGKQGRAGEKGVYIPGSPPQMVALEAGRSERWRVLGEMAEDGGAILERNVLDNHGIERRRESLEGAV